MAVSTNGYYSYLGTLISLPSGIAIHNHFPSKIYIINLILAILNRYKKLYHTKTLTAQAKNKSEMTFI